MATPNTSTNLLISLLLISLSSIVVRATLNLTLPHQHPDPEAIVQQLQRKLNESITSRRQLFSTSTMFDESKDQIPCQTGNPIDDCWRCDPNWANDRQRLADCAIGFGQGAMGGKGGRIYVVTNPSDGDPENPPPGTLRHAVIQTEPLWITFASDMHINLKNELIVNSYKTIDGRGATVHVTGKGCIIIENVGYIIIHGIYVHDCEPSGNAKIRLSPTQVVGRGKTDGDGLTIKAVRNLWIDHCSFARCTDGLVDITEGSTAVTVSNCYFTEHDKVMLLGHADDFVADAGMQVTVAFNHFGKGLVERMPRCRHGYFHVVNNDYTEWKLYAIGGSANPTINSQGNRFVASLDPQRKEVTKRMETKGDEWKEWNWRTEGDLMVNGAFFVPSGVGGFSPQYAKASSIPPMSAELINQLTMHAGVLVGPPNAGSNPGENPPGTTPQGPPGATPVQGQPGIIISPGGGNPPGTIQPPGMIPPPGDGTPGIIPPDCTPFGTMPPGGFPPGTIPPDCTPPGNTAFGQNPGIGQGCGVPGMIPGTGPGMASGGAPPGVLQGSGPGIIPYCGGPGGRGYTSGAGSIHTLARSSVAITISLSSLVVIVLYMTTNYGDLFSLQ